MASLKYIIIALLGQHTPHQLYYYMFLICLFSFLKVTRVTPILSGT